ncbi:OPT oligopeptide transporter protein-domain-containing protein [Gorgonomyces haynaldii]|nr:OPT oligopeptide transporter protein-domain-containing protein [Gorgonomyces haynaldii]
MVAPVPMTLDLSSLISSNIMADQKEVVKDIEAAPVDTPKKQGARDWDGEIAENFTGGVVPLTDDPETAALTWRTVILGSLWALFLSIFNTIFSFRTNAFSLPTAVATLLSYPMGIFLAKVLPRAKFLGLSFNPGAFTIKEHILIAIIAGTAGGKPYGIYNVTAQYFERAMNNKEVTLWNSLAWIFCSQFIGYGLSGLCRRFLVKPKSMLWPGVLPNIALFNSFHNVNTFTDENAYKGGMSKYSVFWLSAGAMGLWHFLPNFFVTSLTSVALLCLISKDKNINFLASTRVNEGVGILGISFDWSVITTYYNPMTIPIWATLNYAFMLSFWGWIITPIIYYTNPYNSPALVGPYTWRDTSNNNTRTPFGILNRQLIYNKNGKSIKVDSTSLLDKQYNLNQTFYDNNKPFFLTASFSTNYFTSFINLGAILSHIGLWYGKDLMKQVKDLLQNKRLDEGQKDIHNELMKAYNDIPEWMYGVYLVGMFIIVSIVTQVTPFKLPIWGPIFGFIIALIYVVPIGILTAVSGYTPGLNIITQMIMGFILPGRTIENMVFKSYGYNIMIQALDLTSDLKLGHYMHIDPRAMVFAQGLGTFFGVVCNTGATFFVMDSMKTLLYTDPKWSYTSVQTFLNAGGIWGAISPYRFFIASHYWFFIPIGVPLGMLLPFIPWLLNKAFPSKYWYLINIPILTAFQGGQGRDAAHVVTPLIVGLITNYWLFNKHKPFWTKYNFVIAVGFDVGIAITTIICAILVNANAELFSITGPQQADYGTYYCRGETYESVSNP